MKLDFAILDFAILKEDAFADVAEILREVGKIDAPPGFLWTAIEVFENHPRVHRYGAFYNLKLVAFVVYTENSAAQEILVLARSPLHRHLGIMTKLLGFLCDASRGLKPWWLEVHAQNTAAISLYKRLGFQIVGHRQKYYQDGGDAVLMTFSHPA